ncbi:MAG: membrane protein insertion efficiency factor YidD [Patescibacteria group bacterium]
MLSNFLKKLGSRLVRIIFIYPVVIYQKLLSPYLGLVFSSPVFSLIPGIKSGCRLKPTCSHYYLQVVSDHGLSKGLGLFLKRLYRCR